ncbi:hypothetical protein FMM05_07480 [Flavobacterium zepuense]|uniref:SdiA-regulated family protein n=1 Tax=Flavobacterium zepuense TaxID=2593302 RepID=A0A552V3S9_9FLAO|nr:hypothetical protein [Flavobacterium zepuense]TRW25140.1 hypothetical protein FMM05_07480 [Flavobacterium zepuense]
MKFSYLLPATILLLSCSSSEPTKLKEIASLSLKEVSGMEYINGELWALEDSGNDNKIYKIADDGSVAKEVTITNATNTDWEDMAADKEGNIYIGDFGNNNNDRKDLAIYKLAAGNLGTAADKITFYYSEQKAFPPKKSEWIYDVESFFVQNGNFYLFTKNRSKGFDGTVSVYRVPNKAGNHAAKLLGTIKTCGDYHTCALTSADISPDGTKVVLLSGDKIWLLTNFGTDNFAGCDMKQLNLNHYSQKEAICFKDNDNLYIADEKDGKEGKKLYSIKLSEL